MSLDAALLSIERACGEEAIVRDRDLLESYSRDISEVTPRLPDAVVRPETTEDVAAILAAASEHRIFVTARSGGTGRVGGAVPVYGGLVLSLERMKAIRGIEPRDSIAIVEPGMILGEFQRSLEAEGLLYGPDTNSLDSCCIGGNIGANAGGPRSVKYGVTRDWVLGMRAVTADGTVLELGKRTMKGVTGFDLAALVIGSEGTLAVVTEATVKVMPLPQKIVTLLVFLPEDRDAAPTLQRAFSLGVVPRCAELLDSIALDVLRKQGKAALPPMGKAMLLLELDGDEETVTRQAEQVGQAMFDAGAVEVLVAKDGSDRDRLWSARRELSHSLRREARFKLSEDIVVPRSRVGEILTFCRSLAERHRIVMPTYGHAGDGNLHVNFLWNDEAQRPDVDAAIHGLFEKVVALGGTLSGEHGIGVLKAPYLPLEQSAPLIALQKRVKDAFDPKGILNPGKIFPAEPRPFHGAC